MTSLKGICWGIKCCSFWRLSCKRAMHFVIVIMSTRIIGFRGTCRLGQESMWLLILGLYIQWVWRIFLNICQNKRRNGFFNQGQKLRAWSLFLHTAGENPRDLIQQNHFPSKEDCPPQNCYLRDREILSYSDNSILRFWDFRVTANLIVFSFSLVSSLIIYFLVFCLSAALLRYEHHVGFLYLPQHAEGAGLPLLSDIEAEIPDHKIPSIMWEQDNYGPALTVFAPSVSIISLHLIMYLSIF